MRRVRRGQKASLTRAIKSGDPRRVIAACQKAVAQWDEIGAWPDDWHRWNIAYGDATRSLDGISRHLEEIS